MEYVLIIVLVIIGWLLYKEVDKLKKDVARHKNEIQEIQTKIIEIDGIMKKLTRKDS